MSDDRFARLPLPSSCSEGEKAWRQVIQKVAARTIPSGCRTEFSCGLDAETQRLVDERDRRRGADLADISIPDLNNRIESSISSSSKKRWMEAVAGADRRSNPTRWWGLWKGNSYQNMKQFSESIL